MYDPAYPPANAEIESAPLRNQFNSLKTLIDVNTTLNNAQIDNVTTGPQGNQGPPGEVSNGDLNNAIDSTALNPTAVSEISGSFGDADAEELRVKLNELITALRR